jgi:hypothetical protein
MSACWSTTGTAAAPTTIAPLDSLTEVRAWSGVQAWTDYSTPDKRLHVVVRSAGQISIPAAIPAGDERLKVDVGPGPNGEPTLAFVSCADVCRVVVSGLDGGRAQTVPGSAGASSPTIWGSRVAWVTSCTARASRSSTTTGCRMAVATASPRCGWSPCAAAGSASSR